MAGTRGRLLRRRAAERGQRVMGQPVGSGSAYIFPDVLGLRLGMEPTTHPAQRADGERCRDAVWRHAAPPGRLAGRRAAIGACHTVLSVRFCLPDPGWLADRLYRL